MAPKILLLQARAADDPMAAHELNCVVTLSGLAESCFDVFDLTTRTDHHEVVKSRDWDAVVIGGSGDYYISKRDLPEYWRFMELLRALVASEVPLLAICYGFHALVDALGGEVVHDPPSTEVGTYEMVLTSAGKKDPLLGTMPEAFAAQMGHKDKAIRLPPKAINLCYSDACEYQGFKLDAKSIWAVQFHPELTMETNLHRFDHYNEGYARHFDEAQRQRARAGFGPSVEANELLARFFALTIWEK